MPVPNSLTIDGPFPGQLAEVIAAEADRLGLDLPAAALPGLAAYASRLWAWNERLNLTRHTDAARFVARDVTDAAALCPHLAAGERLLDVGTGGGVPGVLLAVLRPDLKVELSDSVGKRARAVAAIVQVARRPRLFATGGWLFRHTLGLVKRLKPPLMKQWLDTRDLPPAPPQSFRSAWKSRGR